MTLLYRSASGRDVTHASSSSLDTFRLCRRKFKLSRIDGWKQRDKKGSLEFGKCIEAAIQYYHDNGLKPGDAPDEFRRLWLKWADQPLKYTDQEGSHSDLYKMGVEMTRLYEILLPTFPIKNPKWQLQFLKKLWPGTQYDDLEFMAYVDLLSTLEDGSRLLIDIKTAKSLLSVTPGMMALDGQLRKYAWVSGINEVGFLNFVKARPDEFKKGTNVTLLEDVGEWKAGQPLVVARFQSPKEAVVASEGVKAAPAVEWGMWVGTEEGVQLMDKTLEAISGKGAKEASSLAFVNLVINGALVRVYDRAKITKTRIQFVRGTIPEAELKDIGQALGVDMFALKAAHDSGCYPMDGGVRFPNAICSWCEMLPICNPDPKRRDETLIQIGPAVQEDEWLRELESEETE